MGVGGWVVAVALSGFGGQGCCTVAVSFSKGQKECFQLSPLGLDVIWWKCGGETFDIFRNASLLSLGCFTATHTLPQFLFLAWQIHICTKYNCSYLVASKYSVLILSPFTIWTPSLYSWMATPNPTLNSDHVFTTLALFGFLLCYVERMDLDNV